MCFVLSALAATGRRAQTPRVPHSRSYDDRAHRAVPPAAPFAVGHARAPAQPTVTHGDGVISVAFVAPADNGSAILFYTVELHLLQRRRRRIEQRHGVADPRVDA